LKGLTENNERFEGLTTELQEISNLIKYSDQITKTELEKKQSLLTGYCAGISTLLDQKSYALSLLQQTWSGEHFVIDHKYHK
jgi:hypothetical protein